jgi:DNA-binding winged helix-turn-helix (wHTH) protein
VLKLSDLTLRPDLQLGPMLVSPARRLVEGPGGHAHLEPLIMQVFLLLLEGGGKVVTRNELFDQCWGGVIVGDDSLNRAILKIRRTGGHVAPGLFEIETIPRTGYRLTGEILQHLGKGADGDSDAKPDSSVSRRTLIGGGAAAAAVVGAGGYWWLTQRPDPRFEAVMARGREAFLDGSVQDRPSIVSEGPKKIYEEAVRLNPKSAEAWGVLGYLRASTFRDGEVQETGLRVSQAEDAINRALELNPTEPNAKVAMLMLKGPMLDWASRDRALREVLAIDSRNFPAMYELMPLLQAAGLTRESWSWNERILEQAPLDKAHLVMRAMKLWILGKIADSDRVIERVRGLWPAYEFAFGVRLMLLTLTGRPQAALAMIDGAPGSYKGPPLEFWRVAATALDSRTPQAIGAARAVCRQASQNAPWRVNNAVMTLCALGQVDEAFELTSGYLLSRGKAVSANTTDPRALNDWNRRMTPWLFTPPASVMRADPRFLQICDDFGISAYWRARKVRPDYQVYV